MKTPTRLSLMVLATLALAACNGGSGSEGKSTSQAPPASRPVETDPVDSSPAVDPKVEVRQRAEKLWKGRLEKDWASVYALQDPEQQVAMGVDEFVEWSNTTEPFIVQSYELGDVLTEDDLAWVQVTSSTLVRDYESIPPRTATRWEKWRRVDEGWFPVPLKIIKGFPESPALRDREEEKRLRARFEEAWIARRDQDWDALVALADPRTRPEYYEPPTAPEIVLRRFIDHEVRWVEVIGDNGRVLVQYESRIEDPSLAKLPNQFNLSIDRWVKTDGEWYLVMPPSGEPTTQSSSVNDQE